jgi:hypothetical protein
MLDYHTKEQIVNVINKQIKILKITCAMGLIP